MPNHVHLILVPGDADGLRRALAPLHRRYAGHIHARQRRTGHFCDYGDSNRNSILDYGA
jgi:putative transposase